MGLYYELKNDAIQLGIWKIEENVEELLLILPERDYYEHELLRFTADHRKLEWLSVRALLYTLTGQHITVAYEDSGKPYFPSYKGYLSISHTKGYVAVIYSPCHQVGIDIEQYAQRIHRLSSRFMRDDETAVAMDGDTTWSKLLHWSAKETMFKCMDSAEVDFKEHMHIPEFKPESGGVFTGKDYKTSFHRIFDIHYLTDKDFVLTWTWF